MEGWAEGTLCYDETFSMYHVIFETACGSAELNAALSCYQNEETETICSPKRKSNSQTSHYRYATTDLVIIYKMLDLNKLIALQMNAKA